MKNTLKLPQGYYVVSKQDKETITFRGMEYETIKGANMYSSLSEAIAAADDIPLTSLYGISEYESFDAPVILMLEDDYDTEKIRIEKSIYLFGDHTKLIGSFWFGHIELFNGCQKFLIDGFSLDNLRINDYRDLEGTQYLDARNLTYVGNHPWTSFFCPATSTHNKKNYSFENIMIEGIDGYGYGFEFFRIAPTQCTIKNMRYENTEKLLGFSSFDKKFENTLGDNSFNLYVEDCSFQNNRWQKGITYRLLGNGNLHFNNCSFINCLGNDDSEELFCVDFSSGSTLKLQNCIISSAKTKKLITGKISPQQVSILNCEIKGFEQAQDESFVFGGEYIVRTYVEKALGLIDDKHIVSNGDFSALEEYYAKRKPFYCDMHVHSKSGGTSDGWVNIGDWPGEMAEQKVDFVAIADHRQMRHFFLPEFDDTKFFYANEPEAVILGDVKFEKLHYNMIYPDKFGLGKMLKHFDNKYEFSGDELTGFFKYKNFTHKELEEVAQYITENGGMFVHAHPMAMLVSDNVLDYCFGDGTYIESFSGDYTSILSYNDWKLWTKLLLCGKRVYTIAGSDSHAHCKNNCVNVVYAEKRINSSLYPYFKSGDFTSGAFGIKMMLNKTPMGGVFTWEGDGKLYVEIGDLFEIYENKSFLVKIITDRGVAFACRYDGKERLKICLSAKRRKFYRVEIIDLDYRCPFALSNPIWIVDGNNKNY